MSAARRQIPLFTVQVLQKQHRVGDESKEHRLERIAAEMRRKYNGLANRERARKAARTRRRRQLQEVLPFVVESVT